MASGIECVGLVLAVLPLVIEAGKLYAQGTDSLLNIALQSRRDQRLQNFYDHFWWETVELHGRIREIVNALPRLSTQRKIELENVARLEDWTRDADVDTALRNYFAIEDDFNTFMHVMTRLVSLLAQLVRDSTINVVAADANQTQMYNKLKQFASDRDSKQTSSSFYERFAFWKKEKHRTKCLDQLRIWNKRLGRLIYNAQKEPLTGSALGFQSATPKRSAASNRKVPSIQRRKLSQQLYHALSPCWNCCTIRHEARFCLKVQEDKGADDDVAAEFDFLVSLKMEENNQWTWQEGHIIMRPGSAIGMEDRVDLENICDALESGTNDQRLHLLVEDLNGSHKLWQLRSQPRQLHIHDHIPAPSLGSLLHARTRLGLRDKRRLALILSHSLLQYHDSAWLGSEWGKKHIFFFHLGDKPDLQRPYLSTSFNNPQLGIIDADKSRFHRNPSILALGILLIEIDLEKPIETCRDTTDAINANTDWVVADRIVQSMDQCSEPYRQAIRACLDVPWIPAGQKVCLENPQTRDGLCAHVIDLLESEFDYLFSKKKQT